MTYGLVFAWGAAAPSVRATEHWPDALVGAVFSATPLGYGSATVLGGRLADRVRPRPLIAVAVGLVVTGFAVAFVFPSPVTFIAFYSFLGLGVGGGLALTGALAAASRAFPTRVGTVGGLLTGMYALGAVIEVPAVQLLTARLGWLNALRITGGALAVLAVAALLVFPTVSAPARAATAAPGTWRLLARPLIVTGVAIEALLTPLGAYAFVNTGVFARDHAVPAIAITVGLIAVAVGNAAGRLGGGVLADRAGTGRVLAGYVAVELAAGLAVVAGAQAGLSAVLVLGALGCGIALGGGAGAMSRMAAESAPDAPNAGFGLLFAGFALGALIGPLLGAEIGNAFGGAVPWIALSLGPGLLALAVLALRARQRRVAGPGRG